MLFFTRACLCIGTIVLLAEGLGPRDVATQSSKVAGDAARSAAGSIAALCRSRPDDCMAAVSAAASIAGTGADAAPFGSRKGRAERRVVTPDLSLRTPVPK